MGAVFVISVDGERLMPTFNQPKVRKMLKDGRAVIYKYQPFTIQLTYKTTNHTQNIEFCSDYGSTKEYQLNQKNTNMSLFRLICLTTKRTVMMTEENIVEPGETEKDIVHQDLTTVSKAKRKDDHITQKSYGQSGSTV